MYFLRLLVDVTVVNYYLQPLFSSACVSVPLLCGCAAPAMLPGSQATATPGGEHPAAASAVAEATPGGEHPAAASAVAEGGGSASSADLVQSAASAVPKAARRVPKAAPKPRLSRMHSLSFAGEEGFANCLEWRRFRCRRCESTEPLTTMRSQGDMLCVSCASASVAQGLVAGCVGCVAIQCTQCIMTADMAARQADWALADIMQGREQVVMRMQLTSDCGFYASQPTTSPAVAGVIGSVGPATPLSLARTQEAVASGSGTGDDDRDMEYRSPVFCVAGQQYYVRLFIPDSLPTHRAPAQAAQPATAGTASAAAPAVAGRRGRGVAAPRSAAAPGRRGSPNRARYFRSSICWWWGYECWWDETEQAWAYKAQDGKLRWWLDWYQ